MLRRVVRCRVRVRPRSRPRSRPARGAAGAVERGQALPVVIGVVAVLAALAIGLGWFAGSLVDAARARTAADAAALAGVIGGRTEAARLATENGAELVEFTQLGTDVLVTVRCGRATASARAAASGVEFSTLGLRGRARTPE